VASSRTATPARAIAPALTAAGVVLLALNLRTAVAGIPPLLPDLELSAAGAALLTALPVLCFGVGAAAGPGLRRRLGEERALFAAACVLLAGIGLRAAWPGWALFPGTLLAGAGIAAMNVLLPTLVGRRFPARMGAMTSAFTLALAIGATIAAGLAVPLRDAAGVAAALGIWALPVAAALALWLPQLRVPPPEPLPGARPPLPWGSPLAWQVTLFMGLQSLLFFAPLSWLPSILRDDGLDAAAAGALLSLMNLCNVVGTFVAPTVAVRLRDQRPAAAAVAALTAVGLLGILLAPVGTAPAWVAILGLGQGAGLGIGLLLILLRAGAGEGAARLSAMAQGVGYLLAAAGAFATGVLRELSGGWALPLVVLLAVVAAELAAGLGAGRRRLVG